MTEGRTPLTGCGLLIVVHLNVVEHAIHFQVGCAWEGESRVNLNTHASKVDFGSSSCCLVLVQRLSQHASNTADERRRPKPESQLRELIPNEYAQ